MPAHPSTIASARSSLMARSISSEILPRALEPGTSSSRTGTSLCPHLGAAAGKPVAHQIVLDRRHRARQRRHDAEFAGNQARHVKRRFADADHRACRRCSAQRRGRYRRSRR